MLLIPCPYCGPRPEIEFRYGGEAHIARPPIPPALSDADWARLPLHPHQPEGPALRALAPRPRLPALVQRASRDTVTTGSSPPTRWASAPPPSASGCAMSGSATASPRAAGSTARGRSRFTFDGTRLRAASPATRSPRRCSPTASTSSAAASSITARAASCRAGAEEPNALVQLDAAAGAPSPNTARDAGRALRRARRREPEPLAVARASTSARSTTCCRRCSRPASTTRPSCGRRAFWNTVYEPLIRAAAGLGARADASPIPTATQHRYAHCDVLVVGAGPAGLAAALAAGRSGARVILCDEQAELGGSLLREPRRHRSTASRPRPGSSDALAELRRAARGHAAAAHHRLRLLRPQLSSACSSASTDHLPLPRPTACRASGCGRCARKQVVLATGAIERPLVFAGNDRPGIMLAGAARTYRQPLRRARRASARSIVTNNDSAYARRARPRAQPASRSPRSSTCAPTPTAPLPRGRARAPASRSCAGHADRRHRRPPARHAASTSRRSTPTATASAAARRSPAICVAACPAAGPRPSTCSRSRAASCASTTRSPPSCRASSARRERSAGACQRHLRRSPAASPRAAAAGAAAARRRRLRARSRAARPRRRASRRRRALLPAAAAPIRRPRRKRLRRLPERRHRQGYRARGRARASARSSTSSATPRPAWRPTRARPRNINALGDRRRRRSARPIAGGRHHDLPPALHAGDLRRARRAATAASCSTRSARTPIHDWAERTARCSRMSASGSAPATSRAPARTCTPPSHRECRAVRDARRHLRRLDARQDRGRRARTPPSS